MTTEKRPTTPVQSAFKRCERALLPLTTEERARVRLALDAIYPPDAVAQRATIAVESIK